MIVMNKSTYIIVLLLASIVALSLFPNIANSVITDNDFPEARCIVNKVVDGDTIYCAPAPRNTTYVESKIRFADINAPELSTPEGVAAKNALEDLILGKIVYLDIDDKYGTDIYGRWVAVVYTRHNNTHIMNVNKWLVDNGYANITDYDNEFDPNNWSLYEYYPIGKDNYPPMENYTITNYEPLYSSHGISLTVSPDNSFAGFLYEYSSSYRMHLLLVDSSNTIIANETYTDTDVYFGMLRMASNNSGVLTVWTNYTSGGYSKIVLYRFIDSNNPETPGSASLLYPSSYQYAPMAGYGVDPDGNPVWAIAYVSSSTSNIMLYWYILGKDLSVVGTGYIPITPNGINYVDKPDAGVDYYGNIIYDSSSKSFYITVRYLGSTTGYDIGLVKIYKSGTSWTASAITIDNAAGDQGPPTKHFISTGYSSYILLPNIYTSVLSGKILIVYNATNSTLDAAIYDTTTDTVTKLNLDSGLTVDANYYPRITTSGSEWLVTFENSSYIYAVIIYPNGTKTNPILLGGPNVAYQFPVFNGFNYTVVFGVTNGTQYDLHAVAVSKNGQFSNYAFPISTTTTNDLVPRAVYMSGKVFLLHTIGTGTNTVLRIISQPYSEPEPIPEPPILVVTTTAILALLGSLLIFTKRR